MSLEIVTLFPAFNCITLDADAVVVVVCEVEATSAAPPEKDPPPEPTAPPLKFKSSHSTRCRCTHLRSS